MVTSNLCLDKKMKIYWMSFIGGLNGHYICSIFKAVGETPSLPPINLDKFIEQHINLAFLRAGMCEQQKKHELELTG